MKVLFPIDGSEESDRAFRHGLELLKGHPRLKAMAMSVRLEGELPLTQGDPLARAKNVAAEVGVEVELKNANATREEMLEEARSFDLVVVHALTRPSLRELFTGATPEKIVRHAPTSVLVVRD